MSAPTPSSFPPPEPAMNEDLTVTGQYVPVDAMFAQSVALSYDEDAWRSMMQLESGEVTFQLARVTVQLSDNGSMPVFSSEAYMSFTGGVLEPRREEYVRSVSDHILLSYSQFISDTETYYLPDLTVRQSDFDFLATGEQLTIVVRSQVGEGMPGEFGFTGTLTISGVNDDPVAVDDISSTMHGVVLRSTSVPGVLSNDIDPDAVSLSVVRVGGENSADIMIPAGSGSALVSGVYGFLEIGADGKYTYHPNTNVHAWLDTLQDTFIYQINDGQGATSEAALTITLTPNPVAVVPRNLANTTIELDENLDHRLDDVTAVRQGDFLYTPLTEFTAAHLVTESPAWEFISQAFSTSNPIYPREVTPIDALYDLFAENNAGITLFAENIQLAQYADHYETEVRLTLRAEHDFQFLNEHELLILPYVVIPADPSLKSNPFDSIFYIRILGSNDAPVAVADHNFVYAGQSAVGVEGSASGLLFNDSDPDYDSTPTVNDDIYISTIRFGETTLSFPAGNPSPFVPLFIEGDYGLLTIYSDGNYTYTANKASAWQIEPASETVDPTIEVFTYTIKDKFGAEASAELSIRVLGPNDKPTAVDDTFVVDLETVDPMEAVYNLFANDLDFDPLRLSLAGKSNLPENFLQLDDQGNVFVLASALTYLKSGEALNLFFDYAVTNDVAESDTGAVHVQIIGKNEAPHAHDDHYFYENVANSVFEVSTTNGLISRVHVSHETVDGDIDDDDLVVSKVWAEGPPAEITDDDVPAELILSDSSSVYVWRDGSFILNTPDDFRGFVNFWYSLSDGIHEDEGWVSIAVGGPAPHHEQLMINEVSLQNGTVMRAVFTDNGAAPNKILVGAASIELLNLSDEAISGPALSTLTLELVGPEGSVTRIALGELTGLTQDASGGALNRVSIPAGGILMLYEPGALGLGTWAVYGPNKTFITGASGSYAGQAWPLGSTTGEAMAVNLVQDGTSIDFFAANGADISGLIGVIGLGDSAQDEQDDAGVPWAGDDTGLESEEQYDAMMSSDADTVFGRTSFTDTDSEADWSHYVFGARTVGNTNTKLSGGVPLFVANPEDPTENLNPNQGDSSSDGQDKQLGSGSLIGGAGHDVLMGLAGSDSLHGDELDDGLYGGGGSDSLDGGSGGDWLEGGAGADQLRGGSGQDRFVYVAMSDSGSSGSGSDDTMLDFTVNEDLIDVSGIDAQAGVAGDQAFEWGGAVSGRPQAGAIAGKVVYWIENGMTVVQADVAGDTAAPLELIISGIKSLSVAEFVL